MPPRTSLSHCLALLSDVIPPDLATLLGGNRHLSSDWVAEHTHNGGAGVVAQLQGDGVLASCRRALAEVGGRWAGARQGVIRQGGAVAAGAIDQYEDVAAVLRAGARARGLDGVVGIEVDRDLLVEWQADRGVAGRRADRDARRDAGESAAAAAAVKQSGDGAKLEKRTSKSSQECLSVT